jgi:hypothetical protein
MFGLGQDITRQDMAVIIYRIGLRAGAFEPTYEVERFSDGYLIADYAVDAVYTLRAVGIMNGFENKANPRDSASRAETAQMLYNFYKYISNIN